MASVFEKEMSLRPPMASVDHSVDASEVDNTPLESAMSSVKEVALEESIAYPTGFRLAAIVIAVSLSIFLVSCNSSSPS
jgi:hypothetical protein